ncbi:MAG TPA: hypothetical protein VFS21_22965 [Roseiflexaceae bacterium]|nr:hypothetical protein [Roseiflexaceae bacterium]
MSQTLNALHFATAHKHTPVPFATARGANKGVRPSYKPVSMDRMTQPFPQVMRFDLLVSDTTDEDGSQLWDGTDSYTISVLQPDPRNRAKDRLFVNEVEIAPQNWRWDTEGTSLRWHQSGAQEMSGDLAFDHLQHRGTGTIAFGDRQLSAVALAGKAQYTCTLMSNPQVAYKDSDGILKWQTNGDWKNDELWSSPALQWSYWVEEHLDDYGNKAYRPRLSFYDPQTEQGWEPDPGTYVAFIDTQHYYHFEFSPLYGSAPADNRSGLEEPKDRAIASVFPTRLLFQLSPSALDVQGALEVQTENNGSQVYAVRGQASNPAVRGVYRLGQPSGDGPTLGVHNGHLLVDGTAVAHVRRDGNRLLWSDLPEPTAEHLGLPSAGYLEFDERGEQITGGNAPVDGQRVSTNQATTVPTAPSPFYLYNLDPYEMVEVGGVRTVRDGVQTSVEMSLSNVIQFFMPEDLRKQFISAAPITLDAGLHEIVATKVADEDPREFYASLATPYLTMVLGGLTGPSAEGSRKLNTHRARKQFERLLTEKKTYSIHAAQLYGYHFLKKFPDVRQYLADEASNLESKVQQINTYTQNKRAELERLKTKAEGTPDLVAQYDLQINEVVEAGRHAIEERCYWAHRVYSHFTSNDFMNMVMMQLFSSPDGARAAIRNLQRVSTLLSVLDKGQYFATLYANFIRIFQIYTVIAQNVDLQENNTQLRDFFKDITTNFADNYIKTTDETITLINEYIQKAEEDRAKGQANLWAKTAEVIFSVLSQVERLVSMRDLAAKVGSMFESLSKKITDFISSNSPILKRIQEIGTPIKAVASKILWFSVSALSVAALAVTLSLQWDQLDTVTRVLLIGIGVGLLANMALTIIGFGLNFYAASSITGSFKGAMRWALNMKVNDRKIELKEIEERLGTGFQDKLQKLSNGRVPLRAWSDKSGFRRKAARVVTRAFSNITRVAMIAISAVLSVVTIVMTAIALGQSKTATEQWINGLMLTASILELIGLGLELVAVLASNTLSSILGVAAGAFAGLAIILALVGIGLVIYMMVTAKPISPVMEFAVSHAAAAGLYMEEESALDYMQPLYDKSGKQIKAGVALTNDGYTYLTIHNDGKVGSGRMTFDQTTCFGIIMDSYGRALLSTITLGDQGTMTQRFLTISDSGALITEEQRLSNSLVDRQLWNASLVGKDYDRDGGNLTKANCQFWIKIGGTCYYLTEKGLSKEPASVVLVLTSTKPAGLLVDNITLTTNDRDRDFSAFLSIGGCEPRTWSIIGDLPNFLTFDQTTGVVSQVSGVAPRAGTYQPLRIAVKSGGFDPLVSDQFSILVTPAQQPA